MQPLKQFCDSIPVDEKEYKIAVAALGCVICGGQAEIHHIRQGVGMGQRNSDWNILPLCAAHHRTGGAGVAFHAGPRSFELNYGCERYLERLVKRAVYGEEFESESC